jgi:hypothetical protein
LHEGVLFWTGRLEVVFVALDVGLVPGGVISRQQDGAAGQSGFYGVEAGFGFAGFGD